MSKPITLLIDLDDTLLINPNKEFMEKYIDLLSRYMEPYISAERMVPQLMKSTDLMIEKTTPYQTLESVFDADFYPALGLDIDEIKPVLDLFYLDFFPEIQAITSPREEAIELIQYAFSQGFKVVVATNPLFPKIATKMRLEWAGLPESEYPFDLVTTYEFMHYAKPNPEYYTEILGQIGWPTQSVCMIGNSYEFDIQPVKRLGIPSYLITDVLNNNAIDSDPLVKSGSIKGIRPWLDSLSNQLFEPTFDQIDNTISTLRSTPGALVSLTRHLNQDHWQDKPDIDRPSLVEAISSLTQIEMVNSNLDHLQKLNVIDLVDKERISHLCQEEIESSSAFPNKDLIDFYRLRCIFLENFTHEKKDSYMDTIEHPDFGVLTINDFLTYLAVNDRHYLRLFKQIIDSF